MGLVQLVGFGSFGGSAELLKNSGKHRGHMGRKHHLGYRFSGDHHHGAGINQGRSFLGVQADEVLVFEVGNAQGTYAFVAMYRLIQGSASPPVFLKKAFSALTRRPLPCLPHFAATTMKGNCFITCRAAVVGPASASGSGSRGNAPSATASSTCWIRRLPIAAAGHRCPWPTIWCSSPGC